MEASAPDSSPIVAGDLIPDRALRARDPDEFDYGPIAARIADLCCEAEAPINIALFAPWGSGKSSLATLIEASLQTSPKGKMRLIRYDAWRYGGKALRRHFIAHAARELHLPEEDPRYADFHRGLYENQRRVSLSVKRAWRVIRKGRLGPLIVLLMALVALGIALSIDAVVVGAGISVFLALLTAVINSGKLEVEQSRPSEDEEFSTRFARLIAFATDNRTKPEGAAHGLAELWRQARREFAESTGLYRLRLLWADEIPAAPLDPPRFDRLVFFIDELDRCSRADIVETLKALRTFLDAERCVFVVAADRDVIEAALSKVEQSTPINQEIPHYTTAGAYLDKIFQHQISLPPLRGRSLTKFARTVVGEAGGLWNELAELDDAGDGGTPSLDFVLFTLIPSHVHSPRRIKVLLNNYATNVRMARSRLPGAWPVRAREIARLTAFQTEFPDFAADLRYEPRLPRYLLNGGAPASGTVSDLLARWRLDVGHGEVPDEDEDEAPPDEAIESDWRADPDPFIVKEGIEDEAARERELRKAEARRRQELRRYLERTDAVVDDLRRDLFYLQTAGIDVGLDDPELAELIEAEATDSPERVISAMKDRPPEQMEGAVRLLASMVDDVLGPEQTRVMACLMEGVRRLGPNATSIAPEASQALQTYWAGGNELEGEDLPSALRAALGARAVDRTLVSRVLADERLWADVSRVSTVIAMSPQLREDELSGLRAALSMWMPKEALSILNEVQWLYQEEKLRLMDHDEIFVAFGEALDEVAEQAGDSEGDKGEVEERGVALVGALLEPSLRSKGEATVIERYGSRLFELEREPAYRYLRDQRERILACLDGSGGQLDFALNGWRCAQPGEWAGWAEQVEERQFEDAGVEELVLAVVSAMTEAAASLSTAEIRAAVSLLSRLAPALHEVVPDDLDRHLAPTIEDALCQHDWWLDDESVQQQAALQGLVLELEELMPAAAAGLRELRTGEVLRPAVRAGDGDLDVLRGWRLLGRQLTPSAYDEMLEALPDPDPAAQPQVFAEVVATRAALRRLDPGFAGGSQYVGARLREIKVAASLGDECRALAATAASACLDSNPTAAQMYRLLLYVGSRKPDYADDALTRWAQRVGRRTTTQLIRRLMPSAFAHLWLPGLGDADHQEAPVVRDVKEAVLVKRDSSIHDRVRMAESLEALGLRTKAGREEAVATIVAVLKPKRPRNDLEVALALCRCVGPEHGGSARIERALVGYAKRHKHKFKPEQNRAVLSAGVQLPESYLSKKSRSGLASMLSELRRRVPLSGS